jgi:hypothetical protein
MRLQGAFFVSTHQFPAIDLDMSLGLKGQFGLSFVGCGRFHRRKPSLH